MEARNASTRITEGRSATNTGPVDHALAAYDQKPAGFRQSRQLPHVFQVTSSVSPASCPQLPCLALFIETESWPAGVGKVVKNGSGASKFNEGQRVIAVPWPQFQGEGTWQQYVAVKEENLVRHNHAQYACRIKMYQPV